MNIKYLLPLIVWNISAATVIDEYLKTMEEEASTTGSLAEAAVEKSLAELELAANPVDQGLPQPGLKMGPRPGPMLGQMGEVRWHLASVGSREGKHH